MRDFRGMAIRPRRFNQRTARAPVARFGDTACRRAGPLEYSDGISPTNAANWRGESNRVSDTLYDDANHDVAIARVCALANNAITLNKAAKAARECTRTGTGLLGAVREC